MTETPQSATDPEVTEEVAHRELPDSATRLLLEAMVHIAGRPKAALAISDGDDVHAALVLERGGLAIVRGGPWLPWFVMLTDAGWDAAVAKI